MKNNKFNLAGWFGQLMMVVCLVTVMSAGASWAASVSGFVNYTGSKTGRVYLSVYNQYGNSTGLGTSLSAPLTPPRAYTIRGVPNGDYTIKAFMDFPYPLGFGIFNDLHPQGQSASITVNNSDLTNKNVTLAGPGTVAPSAPREVFVTPGNNCALVVWKGPNGSNDNELAQSYNIYWSSNSDPLNHWGDPGGGQVVGVPARDDGHQFLSGLSNGPLYFAVTTLIGVAESAALTTGQITIGPPAGGTTVSGTVTISGSTPTGPLFVGISPPDGPPFAYTIVASPGNPQSFTVSGVPPGNYTVFASIDQNNNGRIDLGDIVLPPHSEVPITVSGSTPLYDVNIQLTGANATVSTLTNHGTYNGSDSYSLRFEASSLLKLPVTLVMNDGPNVSGPLDLGLSQWGNFQYDINNIPRPSGGQNYNFTVGYSDNSSENLDRPVTAVLDSFARPQTPVGATYGPTVTAPTFTWAAPDSPPPPAFYTYSLRVNSPTNQVWQVESMPMSQLSTGYNSNGKASLPSLALSTTYNWTLSLIDAIGNKSENQVSFTPQTLTAQVGTGSGIYTYNSGTGQLNMNFASSNFICDGPSVGSKTETVLTLDATTMTWEGGMTWTRSPAGSPSNIIGTWSSTDPASGTSFSLTFNANGTMSVNGTIYQCSNPNPQISGFMPDSGPVGSQVTIIGSNFDSNPMGNAVSFHGNTASVLAASSSQLTVRILAGTTTGPISVTTNNGTGTSATDFTVGPAPGTASGTYTYTPGSPGSLTNNWASSTFACDGPTVGSSTVSITTLDATTMVWSYPEGSSMAWTRSPAGTPGSTVGTWNATDPSSGNTYMVTYNDNFTMSGSGTIYQCNGDYQPPTVPTGVTAVAAGPNQINVNWSPSTDNVGVSYYQVYRNGSQAGQPAGQSNTYWPDNSVASNTTYTYTVAACDNSGNCSAQSSPPAQATTPPIFTTITFTSKVTDNAATPAPVAGALVELVGSATSTITDNNGMFSIVVPFQTSFYLRISKAPYVTINSSMMSFTQDSNTSDRPYTLQTSTDIATWYTQAGVTMNANTGVIAGRVASAGNQLMTLPGVTLTATSDGGTNTYTVCYYPGGAVSCSATQTNANGRFYILNVQDGKQITVSANKSGYNVDTKTYQVAAATVSQGRIGLATSSPSYTFTSKLVDTASAAVPGNTVMLFKDSDNSAVGQLATDANGLFTAADMLAGSPYYLRFNGGTTYLETYTGNTSVGGNQDRTNRPFIMYPSGQLGTWGFGTLGVITGTIKDNLTGQPIAGATIYATAGIVVYDNGSGPSFATSTSAANGRFYVYNIVAPNISTTVTITVTAASGYSLTNASRVYHVANTKLSQGSIYLNPSTAPLSVNGTVINRFNLPITGTKVSAFTLSGWTLINNPAITDSNGNFDLNIPSSTPFALEFISNGYRSAYTQDIPQTQGGSMGNFTLMSASDYGAMGWPLTGGRTFIRGMAADSLGRPMSGVSLTASSNPSHSYTVQYANDSFNLVTGGNTFTNGIFALADAFSSDTNITISASKTGKTFYNPSFSHMVPDSDSMGMAIDTSPSPGNISASPPSINFGGITLGSSATPVTISITNSGPGNITIFSSDTTGDNSEISIQPSGLTPCPSSPATFAPGSCTLSATFTPQSTGSKSATMIIHSDAANPVFSISLYGTGAATAPGAPTINSITPGNGEATVTFTAPAFDGGSMIRDYTVSGNTDNSSAWGAGSPLTVPNLSNGQMYTISVTARNDFGTGPEATTSYYLPYVVSTGFDLQTTVNNASANGLIWTNAVTATVSTPPLLITKGITISGGYNSDYSAVTGYTTIPATLAGGVQIRGTGFKVIFNNVKVKAP